jgi:sterol desaturase/sphingolipid hydroxylase (fatty acid hydroxylase superfamily)
MGAAALVGGQDLQNSDNVITAGLSSQVFTLFLFMILCIEFGIRVRRRRQQQGNEAALSQEPHLVAVRTSKWFVGFLSAVGLATVLVFWRCCFRVAELNQGFMGPVTFRQDLFVGFEGILMILVVALLAIFHPALCIGEAITEKSAVSRQTHQHLTF